MKFSIVLSLQPARFEAVAFKGDLDRNLAKIAGWGYDGVELAIRDPRAVDAEELADRVAAHGLAVPAIGTGQAWGEEHLSYSDPDPAVRRAAIERTKAHIPVAHRLDALIIIGLLRGLVRPGVSQAQALEWVTAALAECCAEAARSGVRIALEPINRYETTLVNNVARGAGADRPRGRGQPGAALRHLPRQHRGAVHRREPAGSRRPAVPRPRGRLEPLVSRRRPPGLCADSRRRGPQRLRRLRLG